MVLGDHREANAAATRSATRRATSRRLFYFAMTVTAGVLLTGSVVMWSLFTSEPESPARAASEPPRGSGGPVTVIAVARTAGGPGEWLTYAKTIARMADDTGLDIRVRYVPDRREVIRLFSAGQIDAAFMCTYCYIDLAERGLIDAAARPLINGSSHDAAVLVVRSTDERRSLQDLRDGTVAVSDGTSIAGYAYLFWLMDRNGLDADGFFGRVVQNTSQERNLVELAAGRVDATVVNRSQLARWPASTFRILSSSPEYGTPPFAVRHDLGESRRLSLRDALIRAASEPTVLLDSSVGGFVPARPTDYEFAQRLLPFADVSFEASAGAGR